MTFLYLFTSGADEYKVYTDFAQGLVRVTKNNVIITSGSTFTETETGFAEGDNLKRQCTGTTLYEATAIFDFPYASLTTTSNAAYCGYVAPSVNCNLVLSVNGTDAINNTPSGKLVIGVTPLGYYEFSLNNSVWQSSNVFPYLFPGSYNIYVRSQDRVCTAQTTATILQETVEITPIDVIPYQDARNICYFFRLNNGVNIPIREPLKWDAVQVTGERDLVFHGYKWKYTDGETTLGFDCDSGKDEVIAAYETYGGDAEVRFEYGYTYKNTDYVLFPGLLLFYTYKWYADRVECSVQADDFDTKVQSRQDVRVSMTQTNTYDDGVITPPSPFNLLFHAKAILTQLQIQNDNKSYNAAVYGLQSPYHYLLPDSTEPILNDIKDSFPYPLTEKTGSPVGLEEYNVKFVTGGYTDVLAAWDLSGSFRFQGGGVGSAGYTLTIRWTHMQFDFATQTYVQINDDLTVITDTAFESQDNLFNISSSKTLSTFYFGAKDKIFFFALLEFDAPHSFPIKISLTQNTFTLNVEHNELSESTYADTWFLDDVIRQTIGVIGDNHYTFRSSFFERKNALQLTDGAGSKNAVTNGFQIRNFDIAEKPLYIDFNKIINSLNAEYCIGINYATVLNTPTFRMERRDFFYQDVEILSIDPEDDYITGIAEYNEEVNKDIHYNEVIVGYNKYASGGANSLDEFNTYHEKLTPIKKNAKKLEIKSDFIRSGYSIEDIRREQFAETPSDSVSNDDEAFAVVLHGSSDTAFTAEKNEPFQVVNNLISPETSYNLRLSPARMFYNWFIWLKNIFFYKQPTDAIKTTYVTQNGDLETQFYSTEDAPVGDIDLSLIKENADIPVSALDSTGDLYKPEWVNFTGRVTPDKIQIMNEALSGRYGTGKDYGYLMIKKPDGTWQAGWVYNLTYSYAHEKVTIKMLNKFYTPAAPVPADCCDWLVINGCYILINGQRLIVN